MGIYDKIQTVRSLIFEAIPEGTVIPAHTRDGHFYNVVPLRKIFPSVTGKLQHIKEPGIQEWKMNRSLDYMFAHYKEFTDANIMEHIEKAKQIPVDQFQDAGDIGTDIHDLRERYYSDWIADRARPTDIRTFIPKHNPDPRLICGALALEKFCRITGYIPIATELYVYSEALKVAGTLDDIGFMPRVIRPGRRECDHHDYYEARVPNNAYHCMMCDKKIVYDLVLSDLKTSNQLKSSYWLQVALYYHMFQSLVGLKINNCFILKLDKNVPDYKIEHMKQLPSVVKYAKHVIGSSEGLEQIDILRKDAVKKSIIL